MESISSQEQIRNRLCKSRWRHKNSARFCWTRINSRRDRKRVSVFVEARWAVGSLGSDQLWAEGPLPDVDRLPREQECHGWRILLMKRLFSVR